MGCIRVSVAAGTAAVALTVGVAAAFAGGAPTIGAAPLIPLGQEQVHATVGIDYWRVNLREGDRLTLQYAPQKRNTWVEVCLYGPTVTDENVTTQRCQAGNQALQEDFLRVTARPAGRWTVAMRPYPGCSSAGITSPSCKNAGIEYKLTATVKHPTSTTLRGPNLAQVGQTIRFSGVLKGVRGRVLLQASWNGGGWTTLGIRSVDSAGRFSTSLRLRRKGTLRVRASYPEALQYVGSSAVVAVRVV
jgi:hypothetical protein